MKKEQTLEQLKSLISAHYADDRERFTTLALQLAAREAKQGHSTLAHEIRALIDKAKAETPKVVSVNDRELTGLENELTIRGLLQPERPQRGISSLIVNLKLKERINLILLEYRQRANLKKFGLRHRRKILLLGVPGTGKTMTAEVIAYEMILPLYVIQIDKLVSPFIGSTSAKLRQIFDQIKNEIGVYLFDEFDAIGGEQRKIVGEMCRELNSFLHFLEVDSSDSIIIAATNNPMRDKALFRRFDDVLHYVYPTEKEIKNLILKTLWSYMPANIEWEAILDKCKTLSQSEIVEACIDAVKVSILGEQRITVEELIKKFEQRCHFSEPV